MAADVNEIPPSSPKLGDEWFDVGTTGELYVWDGQQWVSASGASDNKLDVEVTTDQVATNPDVLFRDAKGRFKSTENVPDLKNQMEVNRWFLGQIEGIEAGELDLPEMTSDATKDTLVLRDGNGNAKFNLITAKNFTMNQPTISNNTADTWFLSGGETSNHGVKKNDAAGMRSSLDVYSKAESDALGVGGAGEHDHTDTATSNVAVGTDALKYNLGKFCTAVGKNSQILSSNGWSNTTVGYEAMYENSSGYNSTAIGRAALRDGVSGCYNTSVGMSALSSTNGDYNVGIGDRAIETNKDGCRLVAIGAGTEVTEDDLQNSVMIGCGAKVDASNKIQLGNDEITLVHTHGAVQAKEFLDADGNSIGGGEGGIEEAPSDGAWYGRKDEGWQKSPAFAKAQIERASNLCKMVFRQPRDPNSTSADFELSVGPLTRGVYVEDEVEEMAVLANWADYDTIT